MSLVSTNSEISPNSRAKSMILYGDALYGRKERRRALAGTSIMPCYSKATYETPVQSRPSSAASADHYTKIKENEIGNFPLNKIGLRHLAVHDTRAALSKGIPSKARTLCINHTSAKLYRITGYDCVATASYRECLSVHMLWRLLLLWQNLESLLMIYMRSFLRGKARLPVEQQIMSNPYGGCKYALIMFRCGNRGVTGIFQFAKRFADGNSGIAAHDYKGFLRTKGDLLLFELPWSFLLLILCVRDAEPHWKHNLRRAGISAKSRRQSKGLEMGPEQKPQRKLRLLGLHGFRTSADILRRQISMWSPSLHELIDVDCIDGPLPQSGKSDVEGIFEGPYYEWYRFNKDFTEFYNVDEHLFSYIIDYMKHHGPYDGLLGFSQGAVLSGCLTAFQEKGLALQDVAPIRLLVLISPAQLRAEHTKHVYEEPAIKCPTLAFLGDKDWLRFAGVEVLTSFENCVTINHRYGHTVPRLDEAQTATAAQFLSSQLAAIAAIEAAPKDEVEVPAAPCPAFEATDKIEDVDLLNNHVVIISHAEEACVAA